MQPVTPESALGLEPLRALLRQNASRWRRLALFELVGSLLAAVVAYSLVVVLFDSRFQLAWWLRLAANIGLVTLLAVMASRLVRRLRSLRLTEDQVALAIERVTPGGLQNKLINALQLARDGGHAPEELVRAVVGDNCEQLAKTPLASARDGRPATVRMLLAAGLVAIGVGLWLWQPSTITQAASRFFRPLPERDAVPGGTTEEALTAQADARLSLLKVTYEYPAYTARPARTTEQTGGELEALQGTVATLTFVLDQPAEEAAMIVEGPNSAPKRVPLEQVGNGEFRGSITFANVSGYRLETRRAGRTPHASPLYSLRVLPDQEPRLELSGIDRAAEVQPEAVLALKITASDDFGLDQVGLFARRIDTSTGTRPANDGGWEPVAVWPVGGKTAFQLDHAVPVAALKVAEGDKVEVALRALDTDPLKKSRWTTGMVYTLSVGGEGAALQREYEQILRTEKELKALAADQKALAEDTAKLLRQFEGDDKKDEASLHAAVKVLAERQQKLKQTASRIAREMTPAAGDLRMGLGMLADTELIRATAALAAVPDRDTLVAKRTAVADSRSAQDRASRSLDEMVEAFETFRSSWELANMIPFVKMLAERQKKFAELSSQCVANPAIAESNREPMKRRQQKLAELVELARPAFFRLAERVFDIEPILAKAFADAAGVLGSQPLRDAMQHAANAAAANNWAAAHAKQLEAAKTLNDLYTKLNEAKAEATRRMLAALREKSKTDTNAQKPIEDLKPGTPESAVREDPNNVKIEDLIRNQEAPGGKKAIGGAGKDDKQATAFDDLPPPDVKKLELLKDSGVRQDTDTLKLGNRLEKTPKLPDDVVDRERNKVKPFVQEKFDDLVGKLLDEADELQKNYQSITLSTNQNNNDPGEIGKLGGRLNSTGAVAATGNKKPPTINSGGVSRPGRSGARAYGSILGNEAIARRGRDQAQEGDERVADQDGKLKETKGDDPYKDTSTGVGGKKVESDDTAFSVKDVGKFTPDVLKGMEKPQAKNKIVERAGDKIDPATAALLRDTESKQTQVIERIKAIKKELKTLYLPTDHLDDIERALVANMERLKESPDPEAFRLQLETLEKLKGSIRVFRGAGSTLQPSVPRERGVKGRVVDEPARQTLPGYEADVKRYYEKLTDE
jgi:hypothetical protein